MGMDLLMYLGMYVTSFCFWQEAEDACALALWRVTPVDALCWAKYIVAR